MILQVDFRWSDRVGMIPMCALEDLREGYIFSEGAKRDYGYESGESF